MDLLDESSDDDAESTKDRGRVTFVSSRDEMPLVRSQAHVPGTWAGHCYCCIALSNSDQLFATRCIEAVIEMAENLGYTGNCLRHEEFHISVSRPFYLQISNLEPFVRSLKERIRMLQAFSISISYSPKILRNDEYTRSFLVWTVHAPILPTMVEQCNEILELYDQPPFYEPPIFHISLASFVPPLPELGSISSPHFADDDSDESDSPLLISELRCSFGTTLHHRIPLS